MDRLYEEAFKMLENIEVKDAEILTPLIPVVTINVHHKINIRSWFVDAPCCAIIHLVYLPYVEEFFTEFIEQPFFQVNKNRTR